MVTCLSGRALHGAKFPAQIQLGPLQETKPEPKTIFSRKISPKSNPLSINTYRALIS